MLSDRDVGVARLPGLDEPGVLREPAGIQEQRLAEAVTDLADRPDVGQADRLAAAGVVRHGQHHQRDRGSLFFEELLQRRNIHVALEGVALARLEPFRDRQVEGLRPGELDVGPRGVEVGVVRDDPARPADHGEQDLLRSPALMGRQDVPEREQAGHRLTEPVERGRSGVGFVAPLDAGPLLSRHRPGPRVGEQVDQHLLGPQLEQVVPRGRQRRRPFRPGGQPHRLHRVDAERLNDRAERLVGHRLPPPSSRTRPARLREPANPRCLNIRHPVPLQHHHGSRDEGGEDHAGLPALIAGAGALTGGAQGVVQPVIDPGQGQTLRADLAVLVSAFLFGEFQERLGAGQVVEQ